MTTRGPWMESTENGASAATVRHARPWRPWLRLCLALLLVCVTRGAADAAGAVAWLAVLALVALVGGALNSLGAVADALAERECRLAAKEAAFALLFCVGTWMAGAFIADAWDASPC